MDKETKQKAVFLTEEIMKRTLPYCKHEDVEIKDLSIKINNKAYELKLLIERYVN